MTQAITPDEEEEYCRRTSKANLNYCNEPDTMTLEEFWRHRDQDTRDMLFIEAVYSQQIDDR